MSIEIKMPALSPTMEEGTLAKWLVKPGDTVASGDLLAEIETDKATMEFEAVDEGTITDILVPEGAEGVKVGAVIALLALEGEDTSAPRAAPAPAKEAAPSAPAKTSAPAPAPTAPAPAPTPVTSSRENRVKASPIARRLAMARGLNLDAIRGTGPGGRIVKADVEGAAPGTTPAPVAAPAQVAPPAAQQAAAAPPLRVG